MRTKLLVVGLCAGMTACASVPREQAAQLAKSGAEASDLAARDVVDLSNRLDRQEELTAFTATWKRCIRLTNPATCTPDAPQTLEDAEETERLMAAINLRAQALTALADAYRALGAEADYDAEGAMEAVAGRLTASVNAYAEVLAPGTGTLINAPIGGAITQGFGLIARERQRARLLAGSARIHAAVILLRTSLATEVGVFNGLSSTFAQQEGVAVASLYEAGLIARAPLLQPMADGLGVTLTPEAEQILASNPSARGAAMAFLQGQTMDRSRQQLARYNAILSALSKLDKAHSDFETVGSADIADLNRAIADITALIPARQETGQ